MAAYLEIVIDDKPTRIPCGSVETIGRDKSNTIQIQDGLASRNHALIRRVGNEQYYLLDAGSRNGSYINNQRITTPTLMRDGDKISIGESVICFIQEIEDDDTMVETEDTDLGETISFVRSDIRSVTILVADIRGYTSLSEKVEINVLSKLMSKWFYEVQTLIEEGGGRVDKFIGDCVMALWDTQTSAEDMVIRSLKAAYKIHELTKGLGETNPDVPEELRIGVGINTGIAALGIGHENTVMGDTVNLAFRLESATKTMGKDVVISQSSYNLMPQALWEGREEDITVKGKKKPVTVVGIDFPEMKAFLDEQDLLDDEDESQETTSS